MFPPCRRLFIGALLLLLAAAQCQQAEVGEVEAGKGSSSLADFVNNLIDQMNDVKESREREAKKAGLEVEEAEKVVEEELPFWKVPHEDGDGYCLLLSAEVRLELFGLPGENRTLVVPVSEKAEVEGKCLEGNSEVRFVWHDRHSEEENLINLVVERNTEMPNLVYLSGAFLRLHHHNRRLEFYTPMGSLENRTLLWPIRYQLRCPELSYRLAPIEEYSGRENAGAVLHLAALRIEAFRDITLQNHRPESYGLNWYRREWKCEFHRIYNWAPYLVGCGLCATLLFFVVAFICRDSWEKKKTKKTLSKYESL